MSTPNEIRIRNFLINSRINQLQMRINVLRSMIIDLDNLDFNQIPENIPNHQDFNQIPESSEDDNQPSESNQGIGILRLNILEGESISSRYSSLENGETIEVYTDSDDEYLSNCRIYKPESEL